MLPDRTAKSPLAELNEFLLSNGIVSDKIELTISNFYAYVFADKATVKPVSYVACKKNKIKRSKDEKIHIKLMQQTGKKSLSLEEINQLKIKKLTDEVKVFNNLLGSKSMSDIFRKVLRHVNAKSLEMILFGNTDEDLPNGFPPKYIFPSDDEIKIIFKEYNAKYNLVKEEDYNKASETFIIYFKGCKLIADFVENNSDFKNAVAALHAYKMLVLFGIKPENNNPFAHVDKFFHAHKCYEKAAPIHDTLSPNLPVDINHEIRDMRGWRAFISSGGPKAIAYFEKAQGISKILMRAPENLEEALHAAVQCTYKNYGKYPLLASLCMEHKINEEAFNKCLDAEKRKKTKENLPIMEIDGVQISAEYKEYYLINLPINDPRKYLLGKITNNCQSMGGYSEASVINGVTSEDCGFYVLLKRKNKHGNSRPYLEHGYINYYDFAIVGQSLAWFSRLDNFTFDSWENLRPRKKADYVYLVRSDDLSQIQPVWYLSLEDVFRRSDLCILYKQKLFYFDKRKCEFTEISVARDKNSEIRSALNALKINQCESASDRISYLISVAISSPDDTIAVTMLEKFSEKIVMNTHSTIMRVSIGCGNYANTPCEFKNAVKIHPREKLRKGYQDADSKEQSIIFANHDKQKLMMDSLADNIKMRIKEYIGEDESLLNQIITFICAGAHYSIKRAEWLNTLLADHNKIGLLKVMIEKFNCNSPPWDENIYTHIWEILHCMDQAGILNEDTYDVLDMDYLFNDDMENAIYDLAMNNLLVPCFRNFCEKVKYLDKYCKDEVAKSFRLLGRDKLFTEIFYKIIMSNPQRATESLNMLYHLNEHDLATDEILNQLLVSPVDMYFITLNIKSLYNSKLLNYENLHALLQAMTSSEYISAIFIHLNEVGWLNHETRKYIAENKLDKADGHEFGDLNNIFMLRIKYFTYEICLSLLSNVAYAYHLRMAIFALKEDLQTTSNYQKIVSHAKYAKDIGYILEYYPKITQAEFDTMLFYAHNAGDILKEFFQLGLKKSLLEQNASIILNYYFMKFKLAELNKNYESSKEHYTDTGSLQMFFGTYDANSWKSVDVQLQQAACEQLNIMLASMDNEEYKLKLLEFVKGLTIFASHYDECFFQLQK